MVSRHSEKKLALVLSGGGARGAYEAGILHFIRTALPEPVRKIQFDIYTGTSVGAINACFLAATAHDLSFQAHGIYSFWQSLSQEDVYKRGLKTLVKMIQYTSKSLASNLSMGVEKSPYHFQGLLNTQPLAQTLARMVDFQQIHQNLERNLFSAIAVAATNVNSGLTELFIDKAEGVTYGGIRPHHLTPIEMVHVLASTAIPVVFPPVMVHGTPYIDGGLRLNTPLSSAIQLGADQILTVGLHHPVEHQSYQKACDVSGCVPTLGQVLSRVMNTIFLDRVKGDEEQLNRINRIIEWSERAYGPEYLSTINQMLREQGASGDIADRGLKKIDLLSIHPSEDIGEIFLSCYRKEGVTGKQINLMERVLTRTLDINPESGFDFLSYLTFLPSYLTQLLELGYQDAQRHASELESLLMGAEVVR